MNPFVIAGTSPDKPATIIAETGERMSYTQLADRAARIATVLRASGLDRGDHIAFMLKNGLEFHPICWGAWLAGLYFTPISTHLKAEEVAHIILDSGAQCVIAEPVFQDVVLQARDVTGPATARWFMTRAAASPFEALDDAVAAASPMQSAGDSAIGADMLYSSGTTGQPKGILPSLEKKRDDADPLSKLFEKLYGFSDKTIYLTPAPLYHGSPLKFSMAVHRFGGTNVILSKFDAARSLAAIGDFSVTHSQWVPTMLHRLSRLPEEVKQGYDLSSHQVAIHAAAPCPPELKQQMIDWWGPIIHEFYAGSEAVGLTAITSEEWLQRPGSVGRAVLGVVHIVDEEGKELLPGETGHIYFSDGPQVTYHNDPQKTAAATLPNGWFTLGDMGWLDEDGYLFLSDRKDFMIITGGVNVYPKEIEDALIMHPQVRDVAVFGLSDEEFGEAIWAVVQPERLCEVDHSQLEEKLREYCRARLSPIKTPRVFDFVETLPRMDNGKLYKTALRRSYLGAGART